MTLTDLFARFDREAEERGPVPLPEGISKALSEAFKPDTPPARTRQCLEYEAKYGVEL